MDKERYFLITDTNENSVNELNNFLSELDDHEIEYTTDYDTINKHNILVIVSFKRGFITIDTSN